MKKDKEQLVKLKDQIEKNLKEVTTKSSEQIATLQEELNEAQDKIKQLQSKIDEMKVQLSELENERANHQKLIKEYSKLEQRFEKVRSELLRYGKAQNQNQTPSVVASSSSSATSFNNQPASELESLIEELEQDTITSISTINSKDTAGSNMGHSSLHASSSVTSNDYDSNKLLYVTANGSEIDVSLLSKLNRRIATLELEKKELANRFKVNTSDTENNDEISQSSSVMMIEKLQQEKDYELIKAQELELENQKLREDLNRLRDLVADNHQVANGGKSNDILLNREVMNQFDALNEEVQRRRDECIQLKSLLIAKNRAISNITDEQSEQGENNDLQSINTEGNEFEVGYNTQKY